LVFVCDTPGCDEYKRRGRVEGRGKREKDILDEEYFAKKGTWGRFKEDTELKNVYSASPITTSTFVLKNL
jgi:hypothetical protein